MVGFDFRRERTWNSASFLLRGAGGKRKVAGFTCGRIYLCQDVSAGRLDYMTPEGPFHPRAFKDFIDGEDRMPGHKGVTEATSLSAALQFSE